MIIRGGRGGEGGEIELHVAAGGVGQHGLHVALVLVLVLVAAVQRRVQTLGECIVVFVFVVIIESLLVRLVWLVTGTAAGV